MGSARCRYAEWYTKEFALSRHWYSDSSNWKTGETSAKALKQEMANFLFLRSTLLKSGFVMSSSLFDCWIKWAKASILVTQIQEVSHVLISYGGDWSDLGGWLVEEWKAPHDREPLSMDGCWRECVLGCNQMVSCTVSWGTESRPWWWPLSG